MLEMRVGFTKSRVKRPRSMDGDALSWAVHCRKSTTRRKTTDSVRVIERLFLCTLDAGIIVKFQKSKEDFLGAVQFTARFCLFPMAGPDLRRSECNHNQPESEILQE